MKEKLQKELDSRQTTDTVVMIYPDTFKFNPETASDNKFMKPLVGVTEEETNMLARKEFENAVSLLGEHSINVVVVHSPKDVETPDAVFPNNWFSHHGDTVVLYPMRNKSRSIERQPENIVNALKEVGIETAKVFDLSYHEENRKMETIVVDEKNVEMSVCVEALEGTGSMVLDRVNRVAYAIESPRTTEVVFDEWCKTMDYEGVFFHAENEKGPIYHSNVIMGIGEKFAVISLESIKSSSEQEMVVNSLAKQGREIIDISLDQVQAFCGNLLEVKSSTGDPKIVMSQTAFENFTAEQKAKLKTYGDIVALDIPTIETAGGSARCIMAEVFYK